jgi:hypothetical protein
MINLFSTKNLVVGAATFGICYLISKTYSEIPSTIAVTAPQETFTLYDLIASNPDYKWLDASEFPAELQDTARNNPASLGYLKMFTGCNSVKTFFRLKEKFIEILIEEGRATREQVEPFGRIKIQYPLPNNLKYSI